MTTVGAEGAAAASQQHRDLDRAARAVIPMIDRARVAAEIGRPLEQSRDAVASDGLGRDVGWHDGPPAAAALRHNDSALRQIAASAMDDDRRRTASRAKGAVDRNDRRTAGVDGVDDLGAVDALRMMEVMPRLVWPSWRWMTISGTPSRAISTAWAWRSWCGTNRLSRAPNALRYAWGVVRTTCLKCARNVVVAPNSACSAIGSTGCDPEHDADLHARITPGSGCAVALLEAVADFDDGVDSWDELAAKVSERVLHGRG